MAAPCYFFLSLCGFFLSLSTLFAHYRRRPAVGRREPWGAGLGGEWRCVLRTASSHESLSSPSSLRSRFFDPFFLPSPSASPPLAWIGLFFLAVAATLAVLVVAAAGFALGLVGKVVLFRKVLRVPREHFALKERRAARALRCSPPPPVPTRARLRRLQRAEERRVRHIVQRWTTGRAPRRRYHASGVRVGSAPPPGTGARGGTALARELRRHVHGEQWASSGRRCRAWCSRRRSATASSPDRRLLRQRVALFQLPPRRDHGLWRRLADERAPLHGAQGQVLQRQGGLQSDSAC